MSFVAVFSNVSEIDNPFQWKPRENLESVPEDMIGRLTLKIEEKCLEEEIEFESVILYLALAYEHFDAGNVAKASEILRDMVEEWSRLAKLDESGGGGGGGRGRLLALRHLLLSARTHLSVHSKDIEQARREFEQIPLISSMDAKARAALSGFRATFYAEYGVCGSKAGIAFAEKALRLDGDEALWYFVKGKLLGRVRRVEKPYDIPSPDELDALETACERESAAAAYAIFTAQVYRETANRAFRKHNEERTLHPNLKRVIDQMNAKSSQLYQKSLSLKPHCSHINFRCAKGFMSLPPPFKNTDLAKKCILQGLKMAPTSAYGNHVMAMFYERHDKDIHASVKHLKICDSQRVFGASMDLLRLQFSSCGLANGDVLRRLDQLYEKYPETPRRCQVLSQYVSYYLFVDYVLQLAVKYLVDAFRLDLSCDDVHKHRSMFLRLRYTISLLEVVVDETKIRLSDRNCSQDTRRVCDKFLAELADLNVAYARNRPRYLRQKYLRQSESFGGGGGGGGRRHGGGGGGRGGRAAGSSSTSVNATVSYVRRRNQQAEVDQTLKKIDNLTNSWKTDVRQRPSASANVGAAAAADDDDDGDGDARSSARQRADGDDGDESPDSHVRRLAAIRGQRRFQPPSTEVVDQPPPPPPPSQTRLDDRCRRSLAGLSIRSSGAASGAQRDDDDFDESVLAYRRAKQAADRPQSPPPPTAGVAIANDEAGDGDDRRFDNYLARSSRQMKKKFRPQEIRF